MRRYKQRHLEGFGQQYNINELSISAALTLGLVIIYNTINVIIYNVSMKQNILTTIPLIICLVVISVLKSRTILCFIYLAIGSLTLMLSPYESDLSGAIFIIWAFAICNNKYKIIIFTVINLISLTIKMILLNIIISGALQMIFIYAFIYYTSYLLFFKEKHKRVDISKVISERDKAILKMYANGYSYELIIKTLQLNIETATVRKIIKRIRDESPCKNDVQFGKWLYENG